MLRGAHSSPALLIAATALLMGSAASIAFFARSNKAALSGLNALRKGRVKSVLPSRFLTRRGAIRNIAGAVGTVSAGAATAGTLPEINLKKEPRSYFLQEPVKETVRRTDPASTERFDLIGHVEYPDATPFLPSDFKRYDESPDTMFYVQPRFVTHIDDQAIEAIRTYYRTEFPSGPSNVAILDLCSSWISHYPEDFKPAKAIGLGMNQDELKENKALTSFVVQDLNKEAKLPFEDNTFDYVTNVVSVDYLSQPIETFKEIHRVLKPGGKLINSFSNRCFPTKAIDLWLQTQDWAHLLIVAQYFKMAGFNAPTAYDITLPKGHDPMYVVEAIKQ